MTQDKYVELSLDIIDEQTRKDADRLLKEQEEYVDRKLIPELRKELAVKEYQEKQLARIESEIDILNLASEFTLRIKGGEFEKAYNCFALNTKGVRAEITNTGVYEGTQALHSYYVDYLGRTAGQEGCFKLNHICTPVVEVAGNNRTARGMWMSLGMEALKRPDLTPPEYADPFCNWAFAVWSIDFIKEEGVWKIWHLTVYDEIRTAYEKSWSEQALQMFPEDPSVPAPTRPSGKHNPFTLSRRPFLHEEPPVPYASFQESGGECTCQ